MHHRVSDTVTRHSTLSLAFSSLFEIHQIGNTCDILAIGDTLLFFQFLKPRGHEIAPAKFRGKTIPDHEVALIKSAAFLEAPLQNLVVAPALQDPLAKIGVIHTQKITARAVGGPHGAEILMVILVKLAPRVEPDLVQHPREINHSVFRFLVWALRILLAHKRLKRSSIAARPLLVMSSEVETSLDISGNLIEQIKPARIDSID